MDRDEPVRRLIEIGVKDADGLIDPYEQKGVFQDLETGKIGVEEFCRYLRKHTGKDLSYEDICWAWFGFIGGVPQYKLDYIKEFTPAGRPLNDYFDKLYLSYEIGVTKPDREIFDRMVLDSGIRPEETLFVDDGKNNIVVGQELGFHTYQPLNGEDWRGRLDEILSKS